MSCPDDSDRHNDVSQCPFCRWSCALVDGVFPRHHQYDQDDGHWTCIGSGKTPDAAQVQFHSLNDAEGYE